MSESNNYENGMKIINANYTTWCNHHDLYEDDQKARDDFIVSYTEIVVSNIMNGRLDADKPTTRSNSYRTKKIEYVKRWYIENYNRTDYSAVERLHCYKYFENWKNRATVIDESIDISDFDFVIGNFIESLDELDDIEKKGELEKELLNPDSVYSDFVNWAKENSLNYHDTYLLKAFIQKLMKEVPLIGLEYAMTELE